MINKIELSKYQNTNVFINIKVSDITYKAIVSLVDLSGFMHALQRQTENFVAENALKKVLQRNEYNSMLFVNDDFIYKLFVTAIVVQLEYVVMFIQEYDKIENEKTFEFTDKQDMSILLENAQSTKKPDVNKNMTFSEYIIQERGLSFYSISLGDMSKIKHATLETWFSDLYYDYCILHQVLSQEVFNDISEFADKTFSDATASDHLRKLKIETDEAIQTPDDITEYADILLALFGAVSKAGFTHDDLMNAATEKMKINKLRKWEKLPDGTYQHVK